MIARWVFVLLPRRSFLCHSILRSLTTFKNIVDGNTLLKCSPPIRGPENRDILLNKWKNGKIDSVSSAHVAADVGLKFIQSGNMTRAVGGIGALSSSLSACYSLIRFDASHSGASLEEQM